MEKYRINLEYKGTKLSIDELSIGFYLEIEGPERKIEAVAEELGFDLKEKILVTYWDILEEFNKRDKTKRKDIVFVFRPTKKINMNLFSALCTH